MTKDKYPGIGDLCLGWSGEASPAGRCFLCGARQPCPDWAEVERSIRIENGFPLTFVGLTREESDALKRAKDMDRNSPEFAAFAKGATVIEKLSDLRKPVEKLITFRGVEATRIDQIEVGFRGEIVVAGVVHRIDVVDENSPIRLKRRGGRKYSGLTTALNCFVHDDDGEILCRVDRFNFKRLAPKIIDHGRVGKALWFFAGVVPQNFRMIAVKHAELIGDMERGSRRR